MLDTQFIISRGQMLTFVRMIHAMDTASFVASARDYCELWPEEAQTQTQGESDAIHEMAKALHEFSKKIELLIPKLSGVV